MYAVRCLIVSHIVPGCVASPRKSVELPLGYFSHFTNLYANIEHWSLDLFSTPELVFIAAAGSQLCIAVVPEINTTRTVVYLYRSVSCCYRSKQLSTNVAPAMINSIDLDFVNQERIRRYEIVHSITMTIRTEMVLIRLHMMTGTISRSVIRKNRIAFAVR